MHKSDAGGLDDFAAVRAAGEELLTAGRLAGVDPPPDAPPRHAAGGAGRELIQGPGWTRPSDR